MHDDGACPYVGEYEQLASENEALRTALESLIGLAVGGHEFSTVLSGHCATCTLISQARAALAATPAPRPG